MTTERAGDEGQGQDSPGDFHRLLRHYRTAAHEALAELATALRVSAKTVKAYELAPHLRSARTPPTQVFRHICAHFRDQAILSPRELAAFSAAWEERRTRRRSPTGKPQARAALSDPATLVRQILPRRLTALVGRQALVFRLCQEIGEPETGLVTFVGTAGVGKTRLALEVGRRVRGQFPDGVYFVELAAVAHPDDVVGSIAARLGVREAAGWTLSDRLVAYLCGKRVLLVLDNFEQVIGAGPAIADLLARCEGLTTLITSRAPLHVHGERVREIPPLALAAAQELFVQRVRDVWADFVATAEERDLIGALCARLDGLPLAIELAAHRITTYQTVRALHDALLPALPELIGGPRDLPARQQTMRATIAWSYDVLDPPAQWLLRQLAVCRGGCTRAAAHALGDQHSDVDRCLGALIEQRLVQGPADTDDEAHLWMFEVIREYGLEQLAATNEALAAEQRHAQYYRTLAETARSQLQGPQQRRWLQRLDDDHDNLRAALAWSIAAGDGETALCVAGSLWRYWERRGHLSEGRQWLDRGLDRAGRVSPPIRTRALYAAARLATLQADFPDAERRHAQALSLAREMGDERLTADILNSWGGLAAGQEDYARAVDLHDQARTLFTALGDRLGLGDAHYNLGLVSVLQWQADTAEGHFTQAGTLLKQVGDHRGYGLARFGVGVTRSMAGDWEAALVAYHDALKVARRLRDYDLLTYVVPGIAAVVGLSGEGETSALLFGAAARVRDEMTIGLPASYAALVEATTAMVRNGMARPELFDQSYAAGRHMTLAETIAVAERQARRPDS